MAKNQSYFEQPLVKETYLRARGFNDDGDRTGGIVQPIVVDLPPSTTLFRFYHDPTKDFGEWWTTPHELQAIVDHFARGGRAFATGRQRGKGILHAAFAVRHDWADRDPDHLARFFVVQLKEALKAYTGEGDHAPDDSGRHVQKTVLIGGAQQRGVRQVFLPQPWTYRNLFSIVEHGTTDADLLRVLKKYSRKPMHFEA